MSDENEQPPTEGGDGEQQQTGSNLSGIAPQNLGNSAGNAIQSGLAPVGNTVGKGLGTAGKPVGGLVEPLVGGVMKSGKAFGETTGVGAGNNADTYGKKGVGMEGDKRYQSTGGEEQNAGNPLGLNEGAT